MTALFIMYITVTAFFIVALVVVFGRRPPRA